MSVTSITYSDLDSELDIYVTLANDLDQESSHSKIDYVWQLAKKHVLQPVKKYIWQPVLQPVWQSCANRINKYRLNSYLYEHDIGLGLALRTRHRLAHENSALNRRLHCNFYNELRKNHIYTMLYHQIDETNFSAKRKYLKILLETYQNHSTYDRLDKIRLEGCYVPNAMRATNDPRERFKSAQNLSKDLRVDNESLKELVKACFPA